MNNEARVAIVTGAGGGLGAAEAEFLAELGYAVVVNDVGSVTDSTGVRIGSAEVMASRLRGRGLQAVASTADIGDFDQAGELIDLALSAYGRLDAVVNNAGIVRDSMFVNMDEKAWDDVIRVHLKGTFAVAKKAVDHWRAVSKSGGINDARIINTTSGVGLYGNVGQANYAAAKAGIAGLTITLSRELTRYGISTVAIAPMALTPMTEGLRERTDEERRAMDPKNVAALVAALAGPQGAAANGLVFNIKGGYVSVADGWRSGAVEDRPEPYSYEELEGLLPLLIADAQQPMDILGRPAGLTKA